MKLPLTPVVLVADGQIEERSDAWQILSEPAAAGLWQSSRVTLQAEAVISPKALLLVRMPVADLAAWLGVKNPRMFARSTHHAGLTSLDKASPVEGGAPPAYSRWFTLLGNDDRALILAFQPPVRHQTFFQEKDGFFEAGCLIEQPLKAGDSFQCDTLVIATGRPSDLLESFGAMCRDGIKPRLKKNQPVAWNSWDYYYTTFDEPALVEQLAALKKLNPRLPRPVDTVVLDEGWETAEGDWIVSGRFPKGMAATTKMIRDAGFKAGVWVCPYFVAVMSKAYLRTPQTCAANHDGGVPWMEIGYPRAILDPSSPAGEKLLRDLFNRLVDDGFDYFKLDFLNYLATRGGHLKFHRNELGRIELIRLGLEIVRDVIGNDRYLLACGCMPEAAHGVADACRIGSDISTYTSVTEIAAQCITTSWWMHHNLFVNDPDFLIIRNDATAHDPEFRHNPYHMPQPYKPGVHRSGPPWSTPGESRMWATLVGMSGGFIALSDHVGKLNDLGVSMLDTAIRHHTPDAARPLHLMSRQYPNFWLRGGSKPALAVINWDRKPTRLELTSAETLLVPELRESRDIWGQARLEKSGDGLAVSLGALDVAWFV